MPLQSPEAVLDEVLTALHLVVSFVQQKKLLQYTDLLFEGLQKQRLTGERTAEGVIRKQIYDSLYPLKILAFPRGCKILDLGSGGGFPGIPIKICLPEIFMDLLDANQRKINFLKTTAALLGLDKIEFLCGRAEKLAHSIDHRENYDFVLSKAVAKTAVLTELAMPMLKVGGRAVFYKGPRGAQEAEQAGKAIALCGGNIEKVWFYNLPTGEKRSLYLLKKTKHTPPQYPRAEGIPARKPLQ